MQQTVETSLQYFIGHQLTPENIDDLRRAIANVIGPLGYEPYYADRVLEGQSLLLKISQKIFTSRFSVFDLSSPNPNVYLEMGIALGLNRPIIVIAKEGSHLPSVLQGHNIIKYANYSDLEAKISMLCEQGFLQMTSPVPDYCYFCGQICESMSTPPDENSYLVLNNSKLLWRDLMRSLKPHFAEQYDLHPVSLTDRAFGPMLCDMRRKVLSSQFVICHLGTLSNESSLLSLGVAVGSHTPWILLSKKDHDPVPSNLQGFDRIEYETLAGLEERLTDSLGELINRILLGKVSEKSETELWSLPFWVQFEDWIDRVAHAAHAPKAIQGRIRVVQHRGHKYLSKHVIPDRGLLFGRNPDCDVVVETRATSNYHFRILKGRTGKHYVEDLHSKNGTFLNGTRLSPGEKVELNLNDTIRIPGARYFIWDDRPLPKEATSQVLGASDTGLLPLIPRIEIPDIPPPTYLNTWDHLLVLTALLPDGSERFTFEVQAYYPMGRILSELVNLLDLPGREYRFIVENKFISEAQTPLSSGIREGSILSIVPIV